MPLNPFPLSSPSIVSGSESSELFLQALECLPDAVLLSTPQGNVFYVNGAATEWLALELPEGRSIESLLGAEIWGKVVLAMGAAKYDGELEVGGADQPPRPVSVAVRSMPDGLWLWQLHDLTQRRQLESEWAAENLLLARSSQHKSTFLANMSHELRTPLTSILGFSSILKQRIFGDLNPKQETYIQQIHRSGQHLLSLINDILDLSKIEAGQMALDKERIPLPTLCQESIELVQDQLDTKQLTLQFSVESGVQWLYADEVRVRQMILNLLSNAIKFSMPQGNIMVSVKKDIDRVKIAVQDEGIGMSPEQQQQLFKPFQQVDSSIDRRRQGTGLGLALTLHLAELHGGTVTCQSEEGVGSCFTLVLPEGEE